MDALSATQEDYLEAIYQTIRQKQAARPKDIAQKMDVSFASVTKALKTLAVKGLVVYQPYALIILTSKGRAIAGKIAQKHAALKFFFTKVVFLEEKEAEKCACQIEHCLSSGGLARFYQFMEKKSD